MSETDDIRLAKWIEALQSQGRYAFSIDYLRNDLPNYSATAIKYALIRLVKNGKIVSIHRGYYLIIPPQYNSKGILPAVIFLDAFMKHLNRPYYLALLNAAAFHGASHQQPQEQYVITNFPALRPTKKNGLKINYISKKEIPNELLHSRKTESGYLMISSPILTAIDLIQFEKRVGGLSRVSTILKELVDQIKPKDFSTNLLKYTPTTTLQRLGYILEMVIENKILADALYQKLKGERMFKIPLKPSKTTKGFHIDERWNVIVNASIEIDE